MKDSFQKVGVILLLVLFVGRMLLFLLFSMTIHFTC